MVGDNLLADIRGGANFGIATCWYNPQRRPSNGRDHSDHEIEDLNDLRRCSRARHQTPFLHRVLQGARQVVWARGHATG